VNWAIDLVWAKSHLDPHMVRWHGILIFATIFVSWLLWTQANHPLWQLHIVVDPVVYWQRALSFHESGGTWAPMGMNEYQPGALWFFAGVMAASGGAGEFDGFLRALMVANLLLLAAHVALARIFVSVRAAWLMLLFALLVGPILLCRFELVVSLLVLLAWIFWRRGLFMPAGFLLGTATATKVYPVLFVPLLLVAAWREGRVKQSCAAVFAWLCGGFFIAGALGLFGCDWDNIAAAMRFHFDKPFGVEGLLGSGIPLLQGLLGIPLRMAPRNGIHGFESDLGGAATFVLEWCWLLAFLAVVWAIIARCPRSERCAAPGALFVLFGWYVLLGKLTAPQYAWWALPFLALAPAAWMTRGEWRTLLVMLIAALVTAQFVYPLNYSEFLECFNGSYLSNRIYWLNVLKNILWLCVLVITTRALLRCTADPTPSSGRAT
jgi:hypothetical protein